MEGCGVIKHLVSVSGGKDSTATLLLARELHGDGVLAAFADTGNEHPATLDYVRYLEDATGVKIKWLKRDFTDWWARRTEFVRDEWPKKGVSDVAVARALTVLEAGPTGVPMLDLCIIKGRFPSRMAQFCTSELKVIPLTEYAMELIEAGASAVWSWQGVRIDESLARRKRHSLTSIYDRWGVYKSFNEVGGGIYNHLPILRWTAADVFEAHRLCGIRPNPLYSLGCDRVGCMPCINAGKDEILNIARRWPEHIDRIREWESIVGDASKRGHSTFFPSPGDSENAMERGAIDQVVMWAQTSRGGKQLDWDRAYSEAPACASSFGLCEAAA